MTEPKTVYTGQKTNLWPPPNLQFKIDQMVKEVFEFAMPADKPDPNCLPPEEHMDIENAVRQIVGHGLDYTYGRLVFYVRESIYHLTVDLACSTRINEKNEIYRRSLRCADKLSKMEGLAAYRAAAGIQNKRNFHRRRYDINLRMCRRLAFEYQELQFKRASAQPAGTTGVPISD